MAEMQINIGDRKVKWEVSDKMAVDIMQMLAQSLGPAMEDEK